MCENEAQRHTNKVESSSVIHQEFSLYTDADNIWYLASKKCKYNFYMVKIYS